MSAGIRPLRLAAAFGAVLAAASGTATAKDYPPDRGWSTFWGAFVDEIAGPPGAEALKPLAHFEEAGIAFDYPAVLRVNYDAEDRQWRLWRGDFELEVHVGEYDADHAQRLLDMMGGVLHDGDEPAAAAEKAPPLALCGKETEGWRLRFTFLGDPHEYLAYTVMLGERDARLFVFDDLLVDGKTSLAREATLDNLRKSLRCIARAPDA
ncbi:MAG TPA: hypothetical protein VLF18_07380 [Tahibacter sp.]|uniref:hypothetical protein n=1 Tax=Tahibacter sp. TaxID=2056211 RepID=UPI002C2C56AA|nr:hypothetical protein [Tahibacter sp.]HSX60002.1 hypothetical protein [Tahibacter sp.]